MPEANLRPSWIGDRWWPSNPRCVPTPNTFNNRRRLRRESPRRQMPCLLSHLSRPLATSRALPYSRNCSYWVDRDSWNTSRQLIIEAQDAATEERHEKKPGVVFGGFHYPYLYCETFYASKDLRLTCFSAKCVNLCNIAGLIA